MNRIVKSIVFIALFTLAAIPTFAQVVSPQQSTMLVTANVSRVCTISTLTDLDFGTYDPVSVNLAAAKNEATAGQLSVACTKNSNGVTIEFLAGPTFNMVGAVNSDNLPFTLYQDAAHLVPWGTVAGTQAYALPVPGSKAAQTLNVYGQIPANQDVSVDTYQTTVTASINF